MYSLNLFVKLETALVCGKFSHVFSSATFNSENVPKKASKKCCESLLRHDICRVHTWRVRWSLLLLNHLQTVRKQTLLTDTCCVHTTEPQAFRCICRSVDTICKNITTNITLHYINLHHCCVKLLFVTSPLLT